MLEAFDTYLTGMFAPIVAVVPHNFKLLFVVFVIILGAMTLAKESKAVTVLMTIFMIFGFFTIGFATI